ncbi:hypothetical protein CEXT_57931 [Caerostris extrusa]|uniref:Uncharacterized protein n=1 Tax=Caerostris extrusa TaxID=172846 RepID=A0AAV4QYX7_CAEEX|nr:hypothetical protein CEXT_57931 [Caerostris extrusa]
MSHKKTKTIPSTGRGFFCQVPGIPHRFSRCSVSLLLRKKKCSNSVHLRCNDHSGIFFRELGSEDGQDFCGNFLPTEGMNLGTEVRQRLQFKYKQVIDRSTEIWLNSC